MIAWRVRDTVQRNRLCNKEKADDFTGGHAIRFTCNSGKSKLESSDQLPPDPVETNNGERDLIDCVLSYCAMRLPHWLGHATF